MERSNIKRMPIKYLTSIGFNKNDMDLITDLVNSAIKNDLYKNNHVPYHNIYHIERVLCYAIWILNKGNLNIDNKDLLLYAALYHDCGRSLKVSNKIHGIVGAKIAVEKLNNKLNEKELKIIELLIETHASKCDDVDFKSYDFSDDEKANIQ